MEDIAEKVLSLESRISLLLGIKEVEARVLDEILDKIAEIRTIAEKKVGIP